MPDLRKWLLLLPGVGGLALQGIGPADASTGVEGASSLAREDALERALRGRSALTPPPGAPVPQARGEIEVQSSATNASRKERSWFRLAVFRLAPNATYTLWAEDAPAPGGIFLQFGWLTTNREGDGRYALDTNRGDAMPFGESLPDLAGRAVEVRDADGETTLLAGSIPAVR
ncbi:MAG TPA: hypothetical protein VFS92_10395 [Planctomycetota bacterium]|nr:hypothetical protein [Planctomycetota bacterium]